MYTITVTDEELYLMKKIVKSKIKTYETIERYDKKDKEDYTKEVQDRLKELKNLSVILTSTEPHAV